MSMKQFMANNNSSELLTISIYEKIFIFVLLFLSTSHGGIPLFSNMRSVNPLSGDPVVQITWSFLYLIAVMIVFIRRNLLSVIRDNPLIFILTGYAVFSIFWSPEPQLTFRRSIALIGTTFVSIYLAYSMDLEKLQIYLFSVLFFCAIASILSVILIPDYSLQLYGGDTAWRGIYGHKNHLGRMMFLMSILGLILSNNYKGSKWMFFVGSTIISLALLYLSHSMTSFAVMSISLAVYLLITIRLKNRYLFISMLFILFSALLTIFLYVYFTSGLDNAFRSYLDKDITLTGRTYLWHLIWNEIENSFWLGHGYNGFWTSLNKSCLLIRYKFGADVTHAHSGILGLWLDLGLIGVLSFITLIIQLFYRLYFWVRNDASKKTYIFPFVFIVAFITINTTESMILVRNYFFWIIFVTLFIKFKYSGEVELVKKAQ